MKHTFALCAYKESPYLEECILSLLAQTQKSEIFLSTSTPSPYIAELAQKYGLPVYINEGERGISADWNFAADRVKTPYFTIAHQDDIYEPTFTECVTRALDKGSGILAFTDYFEIREGTRVYKNRLLRVKRMLSRPISLFRGCRFVRRRVLSLGNAICCPSVTYVKDVFRDVRFDPRYAFVCDWDAFERLSRKKGRFYRLGKPLMGHRIHEDSETTKLTASDRREKEEREMFSRFWPRPIVKLLLRGYRKGADSNDLDNKKRKDS